MNRVAIILNLDKGLKSKFQNIIIRKGQNMTFVITKLIEDYVKQEQNHERHRKV